ncbi:hypothetical protein DF19_30265 [Streptomyces olindensis]|nr:hypothetical protein DF19_30265 [Streptomyces olindensis]
MDTHPPRRSLLALAAATGSLAALPAFTATAAPRRPAGASVPAGDPRHAPWWRAPADEKSMIEQGLPVGNGRLGALTGNDPGRELLLITDATMWTGGLNDTLDADGQFPYGRDDFGSFTLLARLTVDLPDHDLSAVSTPPPVAPTAPPSTCSTSTKWSAAGASSRSTPTWVLPPP